jgi:hypothetical protein
MATPIIARPKVKTPFKNPGSKLAQIIGVIVY